MKKYSRQELQEELEQEISRAYREKYEPRPELSRRVREEWEAVLETDSLPLLGAFRELTDRLKKEGHPYVTMGTPGGSFLLYLLGCTRTNPLPPHLYCPDCRRILWRPEYRDGWDIPVQTCPACGESMLPDGHDIPWQFQWRRSGQRPYIEVYTDCRLRRQVQDRMETHWLRKLYPELPVEYRFGEKGDAGLVTLGGFSVGTMMDCDDFQKDFRTREERLPMDRLLQYRREEFAERGIPLPKTAADLISGLGMLYGSGVWDEETKAYLEREQKSLSDVPAFREDLFRLFVSLGLSAEEAFSAAEEVRRGRALSLPLEGTDDRTRWILDRCRKQKYRYLFPRAHCTETLLFHIRAGRV